MPEAIADMTGEQERRDEFRALADERHAEILRTGKTVPWQEMRKYFLALMAGEPAKRPAARKLKFRR